jgi:hypothetical protein
VSGPAGVTDAELAVERLGLQEAGEAFVDFAFAFAQLKGVVRENADTGAIVTAVFESA